MDLLILVTFCATSKEVMRVRIVAISASVFKVGIGVTGKMRGFYWGDRLILATHSMMTQNFYIIFFILVGVWASCADAGGLA